MNGLGDIHAPAGGSHFYNDPPVRDQALPDAGEYLSEVFDWANCQAGIRLLVLLNDSITVPAAGTLTLALMGGDSEEGSFDEAIGSVTVTGAAGDGTALAAGDVVFEILSKPGDSRYAKLKITASGDLSAATVTAKMDYIAR